MKLVESLLFGLAQSISLAENHQEHAMNNLSYTQLETGPEFTLDTCSAYHDRVKQGRNIFYAVQAGSAEYSDSTFPHSLAIRDPRDTTGSLKNVEMGWVDSIDVRFGDDHHKLFDDAGISAHDMR